MNDDDECFSVVASAQSGEHVLVELFVFDMNDSVSVKDFA